jgi:hypothetical protein
MHTQFELLRLETLKSHGPRHHDYVIVCFFLVQQIHFHRITMLRSTRTKS